MKIYLANTSRIEHLKRKLNAKKEKSISRNTAKRDEKLKYENQYWSEKIVNKKNQPRIRISDLSKHPSACFDLKVC